jgi:hypothetical protein
MLREHGLGIEGVDVGGTSVHEKVDDPLRLGSKPRAANGERVDRRGGSGPGPEEMTESEGAESHADAVQELASGQEVMLELGVVIV